MYGTLLAMLAQGSTAIAFDGSWAVPTVRNATRTGGPNDDEDDELRRLMPILAIVIVVAVVFGR